MDSECGNLILEILVIAICYCYEFWIYQALDHPGFEVFSCLFSFCLFLICHDLDIQDSDFTVRLLKLVVQHYCLIGYSRSFWLDDLDEINTRLL
jgi:hypothetical protein